LLNARAFDDRDLKITKAQIGKAGELLVQQKFLLYGIESAPLTVDPDNLISSWDLALQKD